MKQIALFFLLCLCLSTSFLQGQQIDKSVNFFVIPVESTEFFIKSHPDESTKIVGVFGVDKTGLQALLQESKQKIRIAIPLIHEDTLQCFLEKIKDSKDGTHSAFYVGTVGEKDNGSLVAITLFKDKIYGYISVRGEQYEITTEASLESGSVIIRQILSGNSFFCGSESIKKSINGAFGQSSDRLGNADNLVRISIDLDKSFLSFFPDRQGALDYFTAVWNVLKFLASREGINIGLAGVTLWDFPTPAFVFSASFQVMSDYASYRRIGSYSGDITMHINMGANNSASGAAGSFGGPCQPFDVSVAGITFFGRSNGTPNYPNFNANVWILAHEVGHLIGSPHTFECIWGSNYDFALDNCGPTQSSCTQPSVPAGSCTIMGYTQNFNMANGYGAVPSQLIRNTISTAACLRTKTFYASCQLDSFVIWTELRRGLDAQGENADTLILKGTVFGEQGGFFDSRISDTTDTQILSSSSNLPYNSVVTLGTWMRSIKVANLTLVDKSKADCTVSQRVFSFSAPELKLSLSSPNPNPGVWKPANISLKIENKGDLAATSILVSILPQSNASIQSLIAYTGNSAPTGTSYNEWTGIWTVGTLEPGQSRVLEYSGFTKTSSAIPVFSQITQQFPNNINSSPNNNTSSTPTEDDEALLTLNGGGSPPACSISAAVSNIQCNNNGTQNSPSDDTFSFVLSVTGTNTGTSGWTATINGQNVTGTYGTPKNLSGYLISGGALNFTVRDAQTNTCQTNVFVAAPPPCSNGSGGTNAPDLELFLSTTNPNPGIWKTANLALKIENKGNATATNIRVLLLPESDADVRTRTAHTGSTAPSGTSYNAWTGIWTIPTLAAGQSLTLNYTGFTKTASSIPVFAQVTTQSPADADSSPNNNTTGIPTEDDEALLALNGGGTPPACSISATSSNIQCNNNGTAGNTNDDTFSFVLSVTGTNTGTSGWTTTINGQNITGMYGTPKNLSGYLISGGALNFTVRDAQTNSCQTNVSIAAPLPCSNGSGTNAPDLELFLSTNNPNPGIWKTTTFSLKIENKGNTTATNIRVLLLPESDADVRARIAHTGNNATTIGTSYNAWTGTWNVATLAAGQSLTLNYTGFTKTISSIPVFAQVTAQSPADADSSPNNNTTGIPAEDDEALLTLNPSMILVSGSLTDQRLDHLAQPDDFLLYPNPASHSATLVLPPGKDGTTYITLLDHLGRVHFETQTETSSAAQTPVRLDLSALQSGHYMVRILSSGRRAVHRRLVVERGE